MSSDGQAPSLKDVIQSECVTRRPFRADLEPFWVGVQGAAVDFALDFALVLL